MSSTWLQPARIDSGVAPLDLFAAAIGEGLHRARREGAVVFTGFAGPDHPVHPQVPESAYLKGQLIRLA